MAEKFSHNLKQNVMSKQGKAERTKGEWKINRHSKTTVEVDNRSVASTGGYSSNVDSEKVWDENEANAQFICLAVNNHDKLVEGLTELLKEFEFALADHCAILGKPKSDVAKNSLVIETKKLLKSLTPNPIH